jgi:hypothetical protein
MILELSAGVGFQGESLTWSGFALVMARSASAPRARNGPYSPLGAGHFASLNADITVQHAVDNPVDCAASRAISEIGGPRDHG